MDQEKMSRYSLLFGNSQIELNIPDNYKSDLINPEVIRPKSEPLELVRKAISSPIGILDKKGFPLNQRLTAAIAVNDKTRLVPHEYLLPPVLDYLQTNLGIQKTNIHFIIASGTHAPMKPDEFHLTLPDWIISEYEIMVHDCDDDDSLIPIGKTTRNTPIRINQQFMNADLKIVVGTIEPHHFAGFSGGVKTAAIGLTDRETIRTNHAHLLDENAKIASYEQNPLRQDIEEIGEIIGVDLALNVVLNSEHEIIEVIFGEPKEVMKRGVEKSKMICQTPVRGKHDLVIASGGGYPKDINLYQAQKAISHSALILKDGGTIILAAECRDGIGSPGWSRFIGEITSADEIPNKFQSEGFDLGSHKAFLLYRQLQKARIILVSNMASDEVRKFFMEPADSIDSALQSCLPQLNSDSRIAIMPHAINTIPRFE
jgi:nickel-dependent lactate racemase